MKKIAIEEHFTTQSYLDYLHTRSEFPKRDYIEQDGKKMVRSWWSATKFRLIDPDRPNKLTELGGQRLEDMEEAGIDMQVLSISFPGVELFDAADGTSVAQEFNNELSEIVKRFPDRFAGFAAIAPQAPEAAALELDRAVGKLGLKGALITGNIKGDFLDDRKFWPIFETAERLDVPIYIHPKMPPADMLKPYLAYPGLASALAGFAAEAQLHAMRLILSGVFDQYPRLKIILGHMGESIPFWLWRLDSRFEEEKNSDSVSAQFYKDLQRTPSRYFKENFYVTTSGMFWPPVIHFVSSVLGADRILFAADYPFEDTTQAVKAVFEAPISDEEKKKIFHENAEKLLKL